MIRGLQIVLSAALIAVAAPAKAQSVEPAFIILRESIALLESDFANEEKLADEREAALLAEIKEALDRLERAFDFASADQRSDTTYASSLIDNVYLINDAIRADSIQGVEEPLELVVEDLALKVEPLPGMGAGASLNTSPGVTVYVEDSEGNRVSGYQIAHFKGRDRGKGLIPTEFWPLPTSSAVCPRCKPSRIEFVAVKGDKILRKTSRVRGGSTSTVVVLTE